VREVIERFEALGPRLRIIIDDSGDHGDADSGEAKAEARLIASGAQVKRQHMGNLQHNKSIVVDGAVKRGVYGSTNFTWRGLFVQSNNAVIVTGQAAIAPLLQAFEDYWKQAGFRASESPKWHSLNVTGVNAKVTFSPHSENKATLAGIAADIGTAQTSLLYSLAFLYQTEGAVTDAIKAATASELFVYGISDKRTGIELTPARRQSGTGLLQPPDRQPAAPVQGRGERRRRNQHAPQVRGARLQHRQGAGVVRVVQLLLFGRLHQRREPAADQEPQDRHLVHGRGVADLRRLSFPGGNGFREKGRQADELAQAARAERRRSVVEGFVHRSGQDPRPQAVRLKFDALK
jgi:hypothetical protein